MKKRVFALLCALALVFGMLPPARAATAADCLSSITYYGDVTKCRLTPEQAAEMVKALEEWTPNPDYTRCDFTSAYLVDGDGSGIPALVVTSMAYEDMGSDLEQVMDLLDIYSWEEGGLTKTKLSSSYIGMFGYHVSDFGTFDNGQYGWVYRYMHMGLYDFATYTLKNGSLSIENEYSMTTDPSYVINITRGDETLYERKPEEAGGDNDLISQWVDEAMEQYDELIEPLKLNQSIDYFAGSDRDALTDALNAYAQASTSPLPVPSDAPQTAPADPQTILSQIAYYGDITKCRMDAQMANDYADTIDMAFWGNPYDDDTLEVALIDVSGDGYPLLYICHRWLNDYEHGFGDLYVYQNGEVFPYRYSQDAHSYLDFYVSDLEVGTMAGENVLRVLRHGGGGVEPYNEYVYYRVANAQMTPIHWGIWENGVGTAFDPSKEYDFEYADPRYYYVDGEQVGLLPADYDYSYEPIDNALGYQPSYAIESSGSNGFIELPTTTFYEVASQALRAYAEASAAPSYSRFSDILGTDWEDEPVEAALDSLPGEVVACYSLSDGICYVLIEADGVCQGVLVQACRQDGEVVWKVIRTDEEPASEKELRDYVNEFLTTPNLSLDFDKVTGSDLTADELVDYVEGLFDNMTGKEPNDPAKSDLATFIEIGLSNLASGSVSGKDNRLTVDGDAVKDLVSQGLDAQEKLDQVLEDNDVSLGKATDVQVRLLWEDGAPEESCQTTFDPALADALEGCSLQLLLGDHQHYFQLTAQRLQTLTKRYGAVTVQLRQDGDVYHIAFADEDGDVINQLPAPVTVGLPSSDLLNTVMVSYSEGSDNWGGQYDGGAGVISFDAAYSGQYEVRKNDVPMDDISSLSDESQAAIRFMASRGYLDADDGHFRPGDSLNRYEFTKALVGMFFALDRELTTDFPDVPDDSPFYAYVASAQTKDIVRGYSDGTFSGQDLITREQVFALAARTLMEQRGYTTPDDPDGYLSGFQDGNDVSDWAREHLALSVREGITSRGDVLLPQEPITREQAAVVLYRLFLLLYEVPPVTLELPQNAPSKGPLQAVKSLFNLPKKLLVIIAVEAVAAGALVTTLLIVISKRRAKKKRSSPPPQSSDRHPLQ